MMGLVFKRYVGSLRRRINVYILGCLGRSNTERTEVVFSWKENNNEHS
jgi:hypothetical protein